MSHDPDVNPRPATAPGEDLPQPVSLLVQQGIITDEEYAAARGRSEQSGHSIWTALPGTSLVLPHRARPDAAGGPSAC
jgi:hypothetical protein